MDRADVYEGLRFQRRRRAFPRRIIPVGLALALFALLWAFLPHNALFWTLLPLLAVLVWVASYGWRQALAALIDVLQRLERM